MVTGLFICIVGEIMEDIKKQIDELKKKILYHNDLYYNQDNPEIEDAQYFSCRLQVRGGARAAAPYDDRRGAPRARDGPLARGGAGRAVRAGSTI